jgi:hypothetical protein
MALSRTRDKQSESKLDVEERSYQRFKVGNITNTLDHLQAFLSHWHLHPSLSLIEWDRHPYSSLQITEESSPTTRTNSENTCIHATWRKKLLYHLVKRFADYQSSAVLCCLPYLCYSHLHLSQASTLWSFFGPLVLQRIMLWLHTLNCKKLKINSVRPA